MLSAIHSLLDNTHEEMVDIRRYLHQHPELSFEETETAKYIANYYEKLGIPYEKNVGGNGVVATLKGAKPGKTVAFRADFDALPIQDEKDVPYKSQVPGVMHACGHDGHTATLLTFAKVMQQFQNDLEGSIVFIHQHAEEYAPGGAKPIVEAGALKDVDAVFGTHLWATLPLGSIYSTHQAIMAGTDRFEITIQGKGGHGAIPQDTKDAIVIGAEAVSQLQQIVSRRLSPLSSAVISIGIFEAGNAFNIIADQSKLVGTVRHFDTAVQEKIIQEMEQILKGVCDSFGASYTFDYVKGYPPVINHPEQTDLVLQTTKEIDGVDIAAITEPLMVGEDFAYYLLEKPGAFFLTGANLEGNDYPHHHPRFDIDEKAMLIAAKAFANIYLTYQEQAK
ncbi:N-acetyl amino acid acetylase SndC [Oceanobacillus oncorhynchi subsp. oncorhynchi]|uniref:M20 family metallopeptidase n=1 Tax=Oceanobacillus oncorhynchi TaxID=545501 RepID=UPI0031D317C9